MAVNERRELEKLRKGGACKDPGLLAETVSVLPQWKRWAGDRGQKRSAA